MTGIDVVVCARNSAATMAAALERIRSYVPVNRLIVVDGGSTDDTVRIAEEMGCEIYYDGGAGLGAARNLGLRIAETEVMAFIDSDAYISREWYPKLIRHFGDDAVALASNPVIYGYGNPPLERLHRYIYAAGKAKPIGFVSTLLRRRPVLEVGGIKSMPAYEDFELYERVTAKGYKWIFEYGVETHHPRGLMGHLRHYYWWGLGYGSFKPLRDPLLALVESPAVGVHLAWRCHPLHAVYYPMLRTAFMLGCIRAAFSAPPRGRPRRGA
ncbi:MAG: glycosyltransferase family 2 protein [Candidatus Bathyarchaeia archaeon]